MILIDYQNRKPIYEQIVDRFQLLILNGVMQPGDQMPSVRKLAMDLSINPNTIQKAYSMLEEQGYIYPVKGRGNFVSQVGTLKKEKEEKYWKDFFAMVDQGREIGISEEKFTSKLEEYWKEGKND